MNVLCQMQFLEKTSTKCGSLGSFYWVLTLEWLTLINLQSLQMQKVYFLKPFKWYFFLYLVAIVFLKIQQMNFFRVFNCQFSDEKLNQKTISRWRVILCLLRGVKAPPSSYHLMIFPYLMTGWPGWSIMECYTRP